MVFCAEVPVAVRHVVLGGLGTLDTVDTVEANDTQLGFLVRVPPVSLHKIFPA